MDDWRKIGIGLTAFGIVFSFLGVMLFFDRPLLALGNLLFVSGVTFLIGVTKTMRFFFQPRKLRGTIPFFGGILIILLGWPFIGLVIEIFGFFNLFGDFFPVVFVFLRNMPIIGPFFRIPFVRQVTDKLLTQGSDLPV